MTPRTFQSIETGTLEPSANSRPARSRSIPRGARTSNRCADNLRRTCSAFFPALYLALCLDLFPVSLPELFDASCRAAGLRPSPRSPTYSRSTTSGRAIAAPGRLARDVACAPAAAPARRGWHPRVPKVPRYQTQTAGKMRWVFYTLQVRRVGLGSPPPDTLVVDACARRAASLARSSAPASQQDLRSADRSRCWGRRCSRSRRSRRLQPLSRTSSQSCKCVGVASCSCGTSCCAHARGLTQPGVRAGADADSLVVPRSQDDLGFADTGIYSDTNIAARSAAPYTANITALAREGIILTHHYVHWHCSPTRRTFLSGRLPIHHGEQLSKVDTDDMDMRWTWLPQKLQAVGYRTHGFGKEHTGFKSVHQLWSNRGFTSSVGSLLTGGNYYYAAVAGGPRWQDQHPIYNDTQFVGRPDNCKEQHSAGQLSNAQGTASTWLRAPDARAPGLIKKSCADQVFSAEPTEPSGPPVY